MDQNQAWQNNNGAHQQCDMFIYGGWEWKNIKGKSKDLRYHKV
jgi:hypothetical protein